MASAVVGSFYGEFVRTWDDHKRIKTSRLRSALQPKHSVKLVVTPLGPTLPRTLQAYHTSVLVGDQELSFSMMGISIDSGPMSHAHFPRSAETVIQDVGKVSSVDISSLRRTLRPYFQKDTYDLLRKNCNSFSDVCLFALAGVRLDSDYRCLEQAALTVEMYMGLVRWLSWGVYVPNPKADDFSVTEVVLELGGMEKR